MNLGELSVHLGVTADTFTVRDFTKAIGDMPFTVASAISSLAGLSLSFIDLTGNTLDMATNLRVFTAETDDNTLALQQWQKVAVLSGRSADVATSAFGSLAQTIGAINTGYANPQVMQALEMLGVTDFHESLADMMNQIQGKALTLEPKSASQYLRQAGLSPELLLLFKTPQQTREGMSPFMSQGQTQAMATFTMALGDFANEIKTSFVPMLLELKPLIKPLSDTLTNFIRVFGPKTADIIGGVPTYARYAGKHDMGLSTLNFLTQASLVSRGTSALVKPIVNNNIYVQGVNKAGDFAEELKHILTETLSYLNNQGVTP